MKTKIINSYFNESRPRYTIGIKDKKDTFYLSKDVTKNEDYIFVEYTKDSKSNIVWWNHYSDANSMIDNFSSKYRHECFIVSECDGLIEEIIPQLLIQPNPRPNYTPKEWSKNLKGRSL